MTRSVRLTFTLTFGFAAPAFATQEAATPAEATRGPDALDTESTRLVREFTTDPSFLTEWVDHVPEHPSVPSPRDFLGYVAGTPGKLTPPERIRAYFEALDVATGRVEVFPMGITHGGRDVILVAVSSRANFEALKATKNFNTLISDPRLGREELVEQFAGRIPCTYLITAGLHSPETGPPEMVMELAYRLAVSDQPHVREIRDNVLTLIVPVLEVDGRARQVDWYYRHLTGVTDRRDAPPLSPPYWGDYTLHDNNRDGLQLSQPITRHLADVFAEYKPQVALDLHESVPLLYVSLGTGPYNVALDPITIGEWQWMASYDVSRATQLGLRGVWTWAFYTGWYPGYLAWMANTHNGVGRFYETFGNSLAGTFERDLKNAEFAGDRVNARTWYRAWPPERRLTWSLRNNTNYMQTGVLAALQLAAKNRETLLGNFWRKSLNAVERGRTEKPFAFHVPAAQRDRGALHHLLWLLDGQRVEVHQATDEIALGEERTIAAGDYVVRMDQPYRNLALTLLRRQEFPPDAAHPPYDDVSWTYELMLGLEVRAVDDAAVLDAPMELVAEVPELAGEVAEGAAWIVDHRGQSGLAGLRWALAEVEVRALAEEWQGHPAGSLLIDGVARERLVELAARFRVDPAALEGDPTAATVEVNLPRVALFHTWRYTQDSGWARYTLEELGVPFELIDKDDVRAGGLGARFDAILVPNTGWLDLKGVVHGVDRKWSPLAYTTSDEFPSHGVIDSSPDITGGMGFEGLAELQRFVEGGGLLVPLGNAGVLAADSGIAREVQSQPPTGNPGSHLSAKVLRPEHPVTWGYPEITHTFRGNLRGFVVSERHLGMTLMQFGTKTLAQAEREADRKAGIPVEEEPPPAEGQEPPAPPPPPCLSGGLPKPEALERLPALLDAPVGAGRVLFFGWNPLHRHQNHHEFAFLTNALLFFDDFPGTPDEDEMRARED